MSGSVSGGVEPESVGVDSAEDREAKLAAEREVLQAAFRELDTANIRFESNSATLTEQSSQILDNVVSVLKDYTLIGITITGHTDSVGQDDDNLALSQSRAESVRDYLVSAGIPEFRLDAVGFGEKSPIADNNSPEGRAQNRRIEFNF